MCHSVSGTVPFRRNNSHEKTGAKPSLHHIGRGGEAHESFSTTPFEKAGHTSCAEHRAREPNDPPATDARHVSSWCKRTASDALARMDGVLVASAERDVSSCGPKNVPTCQSPPASKVSTVITGEGPASPDDVVNAVGRGCRGGRQELHFPLWLTTARRGLTGKQI
jgi:hypothetical protein